MLHPNTIYQIQSTKYNLPNTIYPKLMLNPNTIYPNTIYQVQSTRNVFNFNNKSFHESLQYNPYSGKNRPTTRNGQQLHGHGQRHQQEGRSSHPPKDRPAKHPPNSPALRSRIRRIGRIRSVVEQSPRWFVPRWFRGGNNVDGWSERSARCSRARCAARR